MIDKVDDFKGQIIKGCAFLDSFTRGDRGFTRQDALAAMQRIRALSWIVKESASVSEAEVVNRLLNSTETCMETARARLSLFEKD